MIIVFLVVHQRHWNVCVVFGNLGNEQVHVCFIHVAGGWQRRRGLASRVFALDPCERGRFFYQIVIPKSPFSIVCFTGDLYKRGISNLFSGPSLVRQQGVALFSEASLVRKAADIAVLKEILVISYISYDQSLVARV